MRSQDTLSATFAALSDPTRRAIITRLSQQPLSVGELASPFDISLPAISRHLKVLAAAGLIERRADAQWRRCYLQGDAMREASEWLGKYRQFWEERFDALDEHLESIRKPNGSGRSKKSKATDKEVEK